MQENYLTIVLKPYTEGLTREVSEIQLIRTAEKLRQVAISDAITSHVKKSLEDRETKLWTMWAGTATFLLALPHTDLEELRRGGAMAFKKIKKENITSAKITGLDAFTSGERIAILEGLLLSSYNFNKYKREKTENPTDIYFPSDLITASQLSELNNLAEAISLTKTLVNEPVNYLDALRFSTMAEKAGYAFGFEVEVLHKEKIKALNMGGILAVNKGSDTPPTFNIFRYKPGNAVNDKPLVLVGKGVTFDTGGYSIKTGGHMSTMKGDMAGGAAVVGTLSAIAGNKLPYYVIGLVPATDNKISADAMVVDDVITIMDGTTVEVQNTDAEGRLILSDALAYAQRLEPELVIDIATLTGSSAAITGAFGITVSGNNQENIDSLKEIGERTYERLVQLPLWKEYAELLKSSIADLKNIGGPIGGASTAAKFLEHFTDYPWIHLDIAGAAFIKETNTYKQAGATAMPLRLLYSFIKQRAYNE